MTITEPLRTLADYERAVKEIEEYFEKPPEPGTEAADRFDRLAAVIKEYEDVNLPIREETRNAAAGDNVQGTLDELISRFEQGLMLASDKEYILALLRSLAISPQRAAELGREVDELEGENAQLRSQLAATPAATGHNQVGTDDIIQRLTDHSLYTKQERNALFIEARDEIAALKQCIIGMLRSSGRVVSSSEMIDGSGSQEYPEAATVCAELYQVIGCLADELGVFAHPDVQRALDNAGAHKLVHRDLLPWPKQPLRSVTEA